MSDPIITGFIPAPAGTTLLLRSMGKWSNEPLHAWASTDGGDLLPMISNTKPFHVYPVHEDSDVSEELVAIVTLLDGNYTVGPAFARAMNEDIKGLRIRLADLGVQQRWLPELPKEGQ